MPARARTHHTASGLRMVKGPAIPDSGGTRHGDIYSCRFAHASHTPLRMHLQFSKDTHPCARV
eukprot:2548332-Alexandrium_andersonii.AAC.1